MKKRTKALTKSQAPSTNSTKVTICGNVTFQDVTKIHPALKSSLGYCLFKSAAIFRSRFEQAIANLKLNPTHVALLSILSTEKSSNQNQMGDSLGIDKASMVKLIDHLEKQKLVERINSVEDRRVKYLNITNKGQTQLVKAREIREALEDSYLAALTADEKKQLRSLLLKVMESLA